LGRSGAAVLVVVAVTAVAAVVVVVVVAAVAAVVVVVVAALAAVTANPTHAVPLPFSRKLTHNTSCQCVEEPYYMPDKQGYRTSVEPRSYALLRNTLPTRPLQDP